MRVLISAMLLVLAAGAPLPGQTDTTQGPTGAPVVLGRDTLFYIAARIGPLSAADRARGLAERLARLATDPQRTHDSLSLANEEGVVNIVLGAEVIASVTRGDALAAGMSQDSLAAERAAIIGRALRSVSTWAIVRTILIGLGKALAATIVLLLAIMLLNRLFPAVYARIESWRTTRIPTIRIQRLVLLSSDRATDALLLGGRITRVAIIAILLFWYVPLILNFFPWTEPYATRIFEWILNPVRQVWLAAIGYIPNLFYIAVIVAVTYYLLRFIRLFFEGIRRGTLVFPRFYPEWAMPTYKIVQFLVLAFALVVVFPYLPGSGSDAFKGVSVFFGVLLSLGSAGAIGNIVAGIVITYMRPFALGDRVKIADTVGDVIERSLLVTRIRTPKHVEVSVPNSMVLSSHITNYSAAALDGGVILPTKVTIGYDTPWRQVHELLLGAAAKTDGIMTDPRPFVLQTALSDSYVEYELNAYTEQPNLMPRIYSDLHQNIQDAFQDAGVQIMSPNYEADPAVPKIPPPYRARG